MSRYLYIKELHLKKIFYRLRVGSCGRYRDTEITACCSWIINCRKILFSTITHGWMQETRICKREDIKLTSTKFILLVYLAFTA